jgi:hypothetical protein
MCCSCFGPCPFFCYSKSLSVPFTGQLANLFVFPELCSSTESIVLLSPVFYVVLKRNYPRIRGARICKRLRRPGIDSEDIIPPAFVAWQSGTTNRVVVPARQAGNRFLGFLKGLKIPFYRYLITTKTVFPPTPPLIFAALYHLCFHFVEMFRCLKQ